MSKELLTSKIGVSRHIDEYLRKHDNTVVTSPGQELLREAWIEIDRLTARVAELEKQLTIGFHSEHRARVENERLRAALTHMQQWVHYYRAKWLALTPCPPEPLPLDLQDLGAADETTAEHPEPPWDPPDDR